MEANDVIVLAVGGGGPVEEEGTEDGFSLTGEGEEEGDETLQCLEDVYEEILGLSGTEEVGSRLEESYEEGGKVLPVW